MESVEAPINEVLGAGMILLTGWKGNSAFVDPMCGSGTLPIDAALIAKRVPPQWLRKEFGFHKWRDFDVKIWKEVKEDALAKIRNIDFPILGFDQDFNAFQASSKNIAQANLKDTVKVNWKKLEKLEHDLKEGILVMNPPYDERLQVADVNAFYKDIGHVLKHNFQGYDAWIITANIKAMKQLGLRPSYKKILYNGALECQLAHYELYRGSRKS